jgi:hypothetical protein
MNLSNEVKIRKVKAGQTSAGTAVESDVVDMQNYQGVVFAATIATANAGNFIKVQQGNLANGSDMQDLAGTKVIATDNAQLVWVDVYKPEKRYVRAVIIRAGTNTVTGDIIAQQYEGRVKPEVNVVATLVVGELHVSPEEGTA